MELWPRERAVSISICIISSLPLAVRLLVAVDYERAVMPLRACWLTSDMIQGGRDDAEQRRSVSCGLDMDMVHPMPHLNPFAEE